MKDKLSANGNGDTSNGFNGFSSENGIAPKASTSKLALDDTLALSPQLSVSRTEFVKLALQTLRSAGYTQAAAALSAESNIIGEAPNISEFRESVFQGDWSRIPLLLKQIHPDYAASEKHLNYLIMRQRYLELIESRQTRRALDVLRNQVASLAPDADALHQLSSLMMCTDPQDLYRRANWPGVANGARRVLLSAIQAHLPSHVMLPENRMATLFQQAQQHQNSACLYHSGVSSPNFPLLADHVCSKETFPSVNTKTLNLHLDEVWCVTFSHNGKYLATAGKDGSILIWDASSNFNVHARLGGHAEDVSCLAWSPNDDLLVSGAQTVVKIWDTRSMNLSDQSLRCLTTLKDHSYSVTAVAWMPDQSGFLTAGMDSKIFFRAPDGTVISTWKMGPYRILDAAISPDGKRMVSVGRAEVAAPNGSHGSTASAGSSDTGHRTQPPIRLEWRLHVYDLGSRARMSSVVVARENTCVNITQDSQYAIVNQAPNEVRLYSIEEGKFVRRFAGHQQSTQFIRNCIGGVQENFIITGSEDSCVYVWNRFTGELVHTLKGHEHGTVNAVAWSNTGIPRIASVGDDRTVRIWEPDAGDADRKAPAS